MSKSARIIGISLLVLTGLLCTQFAWLAPAKPVIDNQKFALKVNLALRRTVHHLLVKSGDSTSRIQPIQQPSPQTFRARINHLFDYNQLPRLLQESFRLHGIKANYDVALLDCEHGELQIGYNLLDFTNKNEVPCGGREQANGCYTLQVTFANPEAVSKPIPWWALALGGLLTGLGFVVWKRSKPASELVNTPVAITEESTRMLFGNSSFDPTKQELRSGAQLYNLTYREAKLLQFFISHLNQIVERDLILKSVWEDEGIIVGRSVDVFVSRLRKMLQDDLTVRIVAVHGVGYRLDSIAEKA